MSIQPTFRFQVAAAAILALAITAFAGCGGGGGGSSLSGCLGYGGGGGGGGNGGTCSGNPAPSATPVGILLTGENAQTDVTYGQVLGYFKGTAGNAPKGSQVVHLTANTKVFFVNTEASGGLAHTASFIGNWSGSFPASSGLGLAALTPSPAGMAIGTGGFTSGNLNPGAASAAYSSGGPGGIYIFGCYFHYAPNSSPKGNMRTVITVM